MTPNTSRTYNKQRPARPKSANSSGRRPQKSGFKKRPIRGGRSSRPQGQQNKLKIIPLGGLEEVGKNMTIFEYGNDIVILDMGLLFPSEDQHGVDYIIPNISYLKGKEKNVKAVIFSHGHLDHIGAAPILLEKLSYPTILGRPMTLAMVKHRQEDYIPNSTNRLKTITIKNLKDKFSFGAFKIKFFQVDHSIMDAVGVILETPEGTVIHPGDWTLEKNSKTGHPVVDYRPLARLKRPTILMLESLGATDVRKSATQEEMKHNLTTLIS
ncbi:MAG: ribonuclease J, partial [Patescibacteria group bacterium]|nr:ribonuclease J [Patescibacteria group bacterium]